MNSTNADASDSVPQAEVIYISAYELLDINAELTGEGHGLRDVHLLNSAVTRPSIVLFGQPQFPTLLEKAAALLHGLAYHHLFFDGNKRTAVEGVARFLARNGLRFDYDPDADYLYVLEIAQGNREIAQIARWLSARVSTEA
jgi:death-on-curing protein